MVYDCKTSSDFKYAKTPEQLANDVQLGGYAMHELELYPQDELIRLRHVYIRTKGAPKAMPVDVVVSREQVEDRHARTVEIVRDMQKVIAPDKEITDPNDLPPTLESCGLYGGCPHRTRCGLNATTTLNNLFTTKKTQTKENIPMSSLLERLRAKGAMHTPVNGATPHASPIIGAAPASIVAPDAPNDDDDVDDDVTSAPILATAPAPSAESVKPKRTRRTKAEIEAAKAAETATQETSAAPTATRQIEPDAPVVAPTAVPTAKAAAAQNRPTLYIDCIPTKGPHAGKAIMYEEWLAPLYAALAEEAHVEDWRLIDFGKGEGHLAALIRSQIADIPEVVVVNGISKARGVFIECVTPLAKDIIKGV
jgi:hypothetical protein